MKLSFNPPGFYATSLFIYFVNSKHEIWIVSGAGRLPRKANFVPFEAEIMPKELYIKIEIPETIR